MDEMEKSNDAFLQGAQQELKKEMAIMQKKILIDTVGASRKRLHNQVIADVSLECFFELVQTELVYAVYVQRTLTYVLGRVCSLRAASAGDGHSSQVPENHALLASCYHGNEGEVIVRELSCLMLAGLWLRPQ